MIFLFIGQLPHIIKALRIFFKERNGIVKLIHHGNNMVIKGGQLLHIVLELPHGHPFQIPRHGFLIALLQIL